ncbi:MAG: methyltransferase domain-containing protein [Planctomycetes bacterium]|nr:methyltransferase domain-containing protein [Planctomycetota bacterium]
MASLTERARFLFHFFRHPIATGAVLPSSRYLAESMVEDMNLTQAETVVEVGPGTGAFTGAILDRVGPRTFVIAVELNPAFAAHLRTKYPALHVINGSAENLRRELMDRGRTSADCVLCSLPWAGFPEDLQHRILDAIVETLRPGGAFATFAYVHAAWFPAARRFRQILEGRFRSVVSSPVVWRNVPPALVYRCER